MGSLSPGQPSSELELALDAELAGWDSCDSASDAGAPQVEEPTQQPHHACAPAITKRPSSLSGRSTMQCITQLHSHGPARSISHLQLLPWEVQLRMCSFLSAQDLCSLGSCCHATATLTAEDILWRRLFCVRWGRPAQGNQHASTWKAYYSARDGEEWAHMVDTMSDLGDMAQIYLNGQRARRQTCLGRGMVDDVMEVPLSTTQERLAAWRRQYPTQPSDACAPPAMASSPSKLPSPPPPPAPVPLHPPQSPGDPPHPPGRQPDSTHMQAADLSTRLPPLFPSPVLRGASASSSLLPLAAGCIHALVRSPPPEETTLSGCSSGPGPSSGLVHPPSYSDTSGHFSPCRLSPARSTGGSRDAGLLISVCPPHPAHPQGRAADEGDDSHGPAVSTPFGRAADSAGEGVGQKGVPLSVPVGVHQEGRRASSSGLAGRLAGLGRGSGHGRGLAVRDAAEGGDAGQQLTWDQIDNFYCCRETGAVHLCDHTCREAVMDPATGTLVCPISCRTLDRMYVSEWELCQDDADQQGHDEQDVACDFTGFVGRAFERGYNCSDERELMHICGVRL